MVNNSTFVPVFTEEEKKSIAAAPVVNQTQLNLEKFERILEVYEHLFFSGQPLSSPTFVSLIRDKIPFPVPYLASVGLTGQIEVKFSREVDVERSVQERQTDLQGYIRDLLADEVLKLSIVQKGQLGKS